MKILTYKDILNEQQNILRKDLSWWPNFLYHFTDVHNASSILYNGWIFSREEAEKQKIMVSDINASCPVPIFFCLNASAVLEYEGTKFAERGIAGHRSDIKNGVEEFQKLQFRKIYHEGPMGMEHDITEYRHSEVIREGGFPVEPFLQCILCRTQAERETLMFLSKMDD